MERNKKGSSVNKYTDNYCVVDLETTSVFISSTRIIELSALKVRNGEVVDTYSTLVNPLCHIPEGATAVNHISDDIVKDSPTIDSVLDSFLAFVGNDIILGYNNAAFDMNIIYDNCMSLKGIPFSNDYIDLLHCVRRCQFNVDNYKLETICKYFGIDTTGEHRALKDCYLTKECYEGLYKTFGEQFFSSSSSTKGNKKRSHFSAETIALQNLQTILETIIEDGTVTITEFSDLKKWTEEHRDLQGNYPFDRVFNALDQVLADGIVTSEELEDLQLLFSDFVDPVKNLSDHEGIASITGKHICVTGEFEYGDRNKVQSLIEKAGGIFDKGVKKATDYVVVGSLGSENWKTGNYGGKILKALQLNDKGAKITIIEESDFIPSVEKSLKELAEKGSWQDSVRDMLNELIAKYELPDNSLYLADNKGQSYSIYIWEPSYPPIPNEKAGKNKLVLTISTSTVKSRIDDLDLYIREVQEGDVRQYLPNDAIVLDRTKSDIDTGFIRIRFNKYSSSFVDYVRENTEYCIRGYESKSTGFACCSRFVECSDAKRCVHENKLYSKACYYRNNLEHGRIFYGKNCNV